MKPEITAEGGQITRGKFVPNSFRPVVRIETLCVKCERPLIVWRRIGQSSPEEVKNPRCNGDSLEVCRKIRILRSALVTSEQTLKGMHEARKEHCPRLDKMAYQRALEAREVQNLMKEKSPSTTKNLEIYACRCGFWHVGNRKPRPDLVTRKRATNGKRK